MSSEPSNHSSAPPSPDEQAEAYMYCSPPSSKQEPVRQAGSDCNLCSSPEVAEIDQAFVNEDSGSNDQQYSFEDQARPWQHWTLSYLNPLLRLGARKVLVVEDCGKPSHDDSATFVHDTVVAAWEEEVERAQVETNRLQEKEAEKKARASRRKKKKAGGELTAQIVAATRRKKKKAGGVSTAQIVAATDGDKKQGRPEAGPSKIPNGSIPHSKPKIIHPLLTRAIFKAFGPWRVVYATLLLFLSSLLSFVPILLLNDQVKYAEALNAGLDHDGYVNPWVEVAGLFIVPLVASILLTRHMVIMQHCAVFARTACSTLLFQKALRVSPSGRARTNTGQVVNMMSVDTNVIMRFVQLAGMTVVTPLQIVISLVLIEKQVGSATWVGIGFLFALVPLNAIIFSSVAKLRRRVLKWQDARVKMTNDVLTGIRVIKYMAWERPFRGEIGNVREEELKALTTLTLVMLVGFSAILFAAPIIQIILVFMTYVLTQTQPLTASVAFTTVALFNMLRFPFAILPMGAMQWIQAQIGMNRMMKYLSLPELKQYVVDGEDPARDDDDGEGGPASISMTGCAFAWSDGSIDSGKPLFKDIDAKEKENKRASSNRRSSMQTSSIFRRISVKDRGRDSKATSITNGESLGDVESEGSSHPFVLRDITCRIEPGSLTCVIGEVGCGKSSILSAMLGEMEALDESKVYIPRGEQGSDAVNFTAFCSQTPWVVNATLRDNIVFGRAFDQMRYDKVLDACALRADIAILPSNDMCEIGERGVGLSGGQKARVCLARALYSPETSLLLLDDPLSSVDSHVGEHLFNEAISGDVTKEVTRVMVTHHTQYLHRCDWIIVMEEGKIKEQGTYSDLLERGINFAGAVNARGDRSSLNQSANANPVKAPMTAKEASTSLDGDDKTNAQATPAEGDKRHSLITAEGREEGAVAKEAYYLYIQAGTVFLAVIFLVFQAGAKAFEVLSSFWLAKWAYDTVAAEVVGDPLTDSQTMRYLLIYAAFGLCGVGFLIARGYALAYHRLRSSRKLHADMLKSILRAPVAFFDVTPAGRIINRFSHDMDKIDLELGHVMSQGANIVFAVLGAIGAMAAATKGTFLVILFPLGWVYYRIQRCDDCFSVSGLDLTNGLALPNILPPIFSVLRWFRKTSTELGRLFSVTKSPIFADFSQMLAGVTVIRAYGEEDARFTRLRGEFDKNNLCYLLQQISFHWIALRLDVIGGLISLFVEAVAVGTASTSVSIPAGWLGLALTYSIEIVTYLKHMVRMLATLEADMSSVERVLEFARDIKPEAPEFQEDCDPKNEEWPTSG